MTRLALATRTPGPLADLTAARRGLAIEAYPLGGALLLRASGDVEGLESAAWGAPVRQVARAKGSLTLLLDADPDADVAAALAKHGARVVPPVLWSRGEARVELDVEGDLAAVVALFPHVRVLARRSEREPPALPNVPELTAKQAAAVATAFEMGYYESPKRVTTGEVAKRLGVARSTLEGHLSRAEKALIGALLPVAKARHDPSHALDALRVYGAFSDALGAFVRMEVRGEAVHRVDLLSRGEPTPESHPYLERVLEHLRTGRGDLRDVPVDLDISGFDKRVLDALRRVPPGKTVTYGELARRLGAPRAARAVGNACAKNPALVVIPCHRVVPSSGGVGSYAGAGGGRTKARLLERERSPARASEASRPGRGLRYRSP